MSPLLFTVYTNDLRWDTQGVLLAKYADDTVIAGLICNNDVQEYLSCIEFVNSWCSENFLDLNVSKTKEVMLNFRRINVVNQPVIINNLDVDICDTYKYLGVTIDSRLKFDEHVKVQASKGFKKLYFVRTLYNLNINVDVIAMFLDSIVMSMLSYGCAAFYGLLSNDLKCKLVKPRKVCCKMLRRSGRSNLIADFNDIYLKEVKRMTRNILSDPTHPLHGAFELMPSGRRYRLPHMRTSRFRETFIPTALRHLNM